MFFHLKKIESTSTKGALCQDCLKLAQWFLIRRFFNFIKVFSLFRNYLSLEKGRALNLNKLEFPSPKDAMCQVWLKFAQWFLRRRFLNFDNVYLLFHNYFPLKKGGPFIWTIFPGILCAKFGWNWPSGSGEEDEKFTDRRSDGQTDGLTDRSTGDQKSSLELSAQVS